MTTEVKIVRENGLDGRILHRHGGSDFHPSHREHSGSRGGEGMTPTSHAENDAANPVNGKAVLTTAAMRKEYADSLKGIEQAAFAAKWEIRKAAMRGARKATANVPSKADAIAESLDLMEEASVSSLDA